jgi:hypothetical protein
MYPKESVYIKILLIFKIDKIIVYKIKI